MVASTAGRIEPSKATHGAPSPATDVHYSSGGADNESIGDKGIWGRGRVTLLGDAAHATINNGTFGVVKHLLLLLVP